VQKRPDNLSSQQIVATPYATHAHCAHCPAHIDRERERNNGGGVARRKRGREGERERGRDGERKWFGKP